LGLFIFGVFLSFGIIAHYCSGARWPTGELFLRNITLWYAGPWTLAVAAVQAGGRLQWLPSRRVDSAWWRSAWRVYSHPA
jgi:hypothetical protein